MTEAFWNGSTIRATEQEYAELARKALEFIASCGGVTSRWQTVVISTDGFSSHHAVADFLRSVSLPDLQYFKLDFEPSDFNEEYDLALAEATPVDPSPLFFGYSHQAAHSEDKRALQPVSIWSIKSAAPL
ncbi:hypothetical protein FRC12_024442 [Ceratobasidium sp. 428]|nr:hypothetical protein FRC12_024442 [Ceratobasidium sp. 428]